MGSNERRLRRPMGLWARMNWAWNERVKNSDKEEERNDAPMTKEVPTPEVPPAVVDPPSQRVPS